MATREVEMSDLGTLKGISDARTNLYNQLIEGSIPEQRANILERILRGQTTLKGELPIKFIKLMSSYKGGKLESYAAATAGDLASFLEGPKALENPTP
jgi:hypothetical protein